MGRAQAGRVFVSGPLNKHLPTAVSSLSLSSHIPLIHHRHSCSHKHSHTKTPSQKKKKLRAGLPGQVEWSQCGVLTASRKPSSPADAPPQ